MISKELAKVWQVIGRELNFKISIKSLYLRVLRNQKKIWSKLNSNEVNLDKDAAIIAQNISHDSIRVFLRMQ